MIDFSIVLLPWHFTESVILLHLPKQRTEFYSHNVFPGLTGRFRNNHFQFSVVFGKCLKLSGICRTVWSKQLFPEMPYNFRHCQEYLISPYDCSVVRPSQAVSSHAVMLDVQSMPFIVIVSSVSVCPLGKFSLWFWWQWWWWSSSTSRSSWLWWWGGGREGRGTHEVTSPAQTLFHSKHSKFLSVLLLGAAACGGGGGINLLWSQATIWMRMIDDGGSDDDDVIVVVVVFVGAEGGCWYERGAVCEFFLEQAQSPGSWQRYSRSVL